MNKKMSKPSSVDFITLLLFFYLQLLFAFQNVCALQIHHDTRCICKCKGHAYFPSDAIYIESPSTNISSCICPKVVLPRVNLEIEESTLYCLGCECKFEQRSIRKIQISVGIVIMVTSALVTYGIFLVCLQPIVKKPISKSRHIDTVYQEYQDIGDGYESFGFYDSHGTDEEKEDFSTTPSSRPKHAIEETLKKLINKQDKWKEQLEIQRSKIYN